MCKDPSTDGETRAWVWVLNSEGTLSFLSASDCRRDVGTASGACAAFPEKMECTQTNPFSFRIALIRVFAAIVCFLLLISATTTTKKKLNHDSVTSCVDHLGQSIHWVTQSSEMLTHFRWSLHRWSPTDTGITTKLSRKKLILKTVFVKVCICTDASMWVPVKARRGLQVTTYGCWESNLGPLQERHAFLISAPTFQLAYNLKHWELSSLSYRCECPKILILHENVITHTSYWHLSENGYQSRGKNMLLHVP